MIFICLKFVALYLYRASVPAFFALYTRLIDDDERCCVTVCTVFALFT